MTGCLACSLLGEGNLVGDQHAGDGGGGEGGKDTREQSGKGDA